MDVERNLRLEDDDGVVRTGTLKTATAHVITAVIGSGVLSLAWAIAQLGWIVGSLVLLIFAFITWFCLNLLADCYRYPDPIFGRRNQSYREAVKSYLGDSNYRLCAVAQYINLVGASIGYTITSAISMAAILKSNCYHKKGHDANCEQSATLFIIIFAFLQIFFSQVPNFHKLSWLSYVAAIMSFSYSSIGLGLSIAHIAENGVGETSMTGTVIGVDTTMSEKVWKSLQAIANMAFAYNYSMVLIEIQNTLKPDPPENKVMKKASTIGVAVTTVFYMLCGLLGYAAFGNNAPGNFLTGFGFYEPFWLVDIGNICVVVHLVGAYQVFSQPFFEFIEASVDNKWPSNKLTQSEHAINVPLKGSCSINLFRIVWRTVYVLITALIAMLFPFFNDVIGFLGAVTFWPLVIYFPFEMYMKRTKVSKTSSTGIWLMILNVGCLIISIAAMVATVQGLIESVRNYKPFQIS